MKPEAQRIAIATACGWTNLEWLPVRFKIEGRPDTYLSGKPPENGPLYPFNEPPFYLTDLNAMHEAEKVLTGRRECPPIGQWSDYWQHLISVCYPVLATHATAAQRAEAFLRTLGKWEDSK